MHRLHGLIFAVLVAAAGCVSPGEYFRNGFKVGPNYCPPHAATANDWIDADDSHVSTAEDDLARWWSVFHDPKLDSLIQMAVSQNLTLREAGYRILQARAARAIVAGNLLPQQQDAFGAGARNAASISAANTQFLTRRFYDQWDAGFNLAWELDFWGRFRRAIEAADADLDASVANYDQVVVTLLGDIASTYVEIRTLQTRIELIRENVKLQRETYIIADARFRGGQVSELDVDQSVSTLSQIEAAIPQLQLQQREASNRLCVLLGMPPADLRSLLGEGPIPDAPAEVVVGIPADLLRQRPDLRRAEREIQAQSARVGIATSELFPHIGITGTLDYSAEHFDKLFGPRSLQGGIGPSFRWNILNYGRLLNGIRLQDAKLAERIVSYQNQVLTANAEAENGIARFLRGRERVAWLKRSVDAAQKAVKIAVTQYKGGIIDFNWVSIIQQNLVNQQELLAQAEGDTTQGLVETYRALGGGWQCAYESPSAFVQTVNAEEIPAPIERLPPVGP